LRSPSDFYIQNGVDAFIVIGGEPVKSETLITAKIFVEQNIGAEIPKEKWLMLCELIADAEWTEERFKRTLKWFLLNKCYPAWTFKDWFDYGVKLYPFQWVRQHCHKNGLREVDFIRSLDVYFVDGIRLYKMKDGIELPLKKEVY